MVATRISAAAILLFVLAFAQCAGAFSGSINNSSGDIVSKNNWAGGATAISWNVTYASGFWNYHYTITVPQTSISHFILETSPNFTSGLIKNFVVHQGSIGSYSVSTFNAPPPAQPENQPNPYMPADIYGIKFDDTSGLILEFSFDCERMPVWGDFYTKGGSKHAAFNSGFASVDPTAPASDGSLDGHILVPDTVVPEPASVVAILSGIAGLFLRKRM